MSDTPLSPVLDRLVEALSRCLTEESVKRLLKLRADPQLQALVAELGEKSSEGTLSPEEETEYASLVSFGTVVALLKSKVRQQLAQSSGA